MNAQFAREFFELCTTTSAMGVEPDVGLSSRRESSDLRESLLRGETPRSPRAASAIDGQTCELRQQTQADFLAMCYM
jgi:hypothetical protein